jgi:hypothetical protein
MKKLSLYAISTAAMFAAGVGMASAADLGGNCCADLEERVAELEATVAKKGNRKVSLTISGQVNRMITHWSAGQVDPAGVRIAGRTSSTYLGIDNTNTSTRFGLSGSAKINAEWSAGYSILMDLANGARSFSFTQRDEDGGANDAALRVRDANWWLQSDRLGRLTVGRLTGSGPVSMIDLGGIGVIGSVAHGLIGGGLVVAGTTTMNNWTDNGGDWANRGDGMKWTSPTLQGFVVSASVTETLKESSTLAPVPPAHNSNGRIIGVDLKYANEFNGVRVAWGIGYETLNDSETPAAASPDVETWGTSLALLHTATGLFLQGDYVSKEVSIGAVAPTSREADRWNIQGGVMRNFFGIGNTSLYAEYGRGEGWLEVNRTVATAAINTGFDAAIDSKYKVWGVGVVQNVDAAAMELYAGYRALSFSEGPGATAAFAGSGDVRLFSAGARIKF